MPDLLEKYRKMRDFGETPEPSGASKRKKSKLPIFVIQKHRASHLHYDFRLEMQGVLKSWAVPKGPSYDPKVRRLAMMTEDHPYDYASFEGVIPEGNYGAGNVIIWDEGGWEFLEPGDDPVKALAGGKLTFRLHGKKMFGEWALVRIKGRSSSDRGNEWLLLKHRDEFANENIDVTSFAPRSVVSNLTVEEVGADNVWISNRKAASRKAPTLASRLSRGKRASSAKSPAATRRTSAAAAKSTARTKASSSASGTGGMKKRPAKAKGAAKRRSATARAAGKRAPQSTKKSAAKKSQTPGRPRSSRGASAPSRSSRVRARS